MTGESRSSENSYKLGDTVRWFSQAGGFVKEKVGVVVAIVPAGFRPDHEQFKSLHRGNGCGFARDHDSYVVQVKSKYYWPRRSSLQ